MAANRMSGVGWSTALLWCSPSHTESNPAASARSHSRIVSSNSPPACSGLSPSFMSAPLAHLGGIAPARESARTKRRRSSLASGIQRTRNLVKVVDRTTPLGLSVRDDGTVHYQDVQLGRDLGRSVEILAGLTGSERLIVNPPDGLNEARACPPRSAGGARTAERARDRSRPGGCRRSSRSGR